MMKRIGKFINSLFEKTVVLIFAISLIQLPNYMQQYMLFLDGYVLSLREEIADFQKNAEHHGISLKSYIDSHLNSNDKVIRSTGETIQAHIEKKEQIEAAVERFHKASLWMRPVVFATIFDFSLAKQINAKPGFSFTIETLAYALTGMLLGMIAYSLFLQPLFLGLLRVLHLRRPAKA